MRQQLVDKAQRHPTVRHLQSNSRSETADKACTLLTNPQNLATQELYNHQGRKLAVTA